MKTSIKFFLVLFLFISKISISQQIPTYTLAASNFHLISPGDLRFDIYIKHTNYTVPFNYSAGQYMLYFNPDFANGGTLTFKYIGSELDTSGRPRNIGIVNSILRLAMNFLPGAGKYCDISHEGLGTLVGKFSLVNTTNFLPLDSSGLRWRNIAHGNPYTKIFAYVGNTISDITDSSGHSVDFLTSISEPINNIHPVNFILYQNYPNPFNPKTIINYESRITSYVLLKIFDINGKEVSTLVNRKNNSGNYSIEWGASDYGSGIYFYKLETESFEETKRMILLK